MGEGFTILRGAVAWCLLASTGAAGKTPPPGQNPLAAATPAAKSLVLLTLDTTRADHLGCYGDKTARTPHLDSLAARGARFARALSPAPLTLVAHCSLLTGLEAPEHGVRDNGTAVLPAELPTLATILSAHGYQTAAFVASRVLDRRFGLDRGFAVYDDQMPAEQVGEYGYPERDARQVTDAAIAWARRADPGRPYFVWIHYYDPHSPYAPPSSWGGASDRERYAGEIAYMDHEIGRLLKALPGDTQRRLIAAVGDHGEMLGEHGERAHGFLLYRAALEVPLILSGPGVPAGRVIAGAVATRRLAPTLLHLLGFAQELSAQSGLPGLQADPDQGTWPAIYSETRFPATAFGWSDLRALSRRNLRLVLGPRPALYDFLADPGETTNLIDSHTRDAHELRREVADLEASWRPHAAPAPQPDAALAAALRNLGYLSGASGNRSGTIDPQDGVKMLAEFERGKAELAAGRVEAARSILAALVQRSPASVPFLNQLARAQLRLGKGDDALVTYHRMVALNPTLDFLHLNLADALRELRRAADARAEYEIVLKINPRFAAAWMRLAQMAEEEDRPAEARSILRRAVETGAQSATIFTRLGELEMAVGDDVLAARDFQNATEVSAQWAPAWLRWGELLERAGNPVEARERYLKAAAASPEDAEAFVGLARLAAKAGDKVVAQRYLEQALKRHPSASLAPEIQRLRQSFR